MEENYFHYRLSIISDSHQNFYDENLKTLINRNNFYELLPFLDLKKKLDIEENLRLNVVDFNLMEVDQESQEITTISPASKLFLETTYGIEQLYKKNEWHKQIKVLKTLFQETGDATIFQKIVAYWLLNSDLKELMIIYPHLQKVSFQIMESLGDKIIFVDDLESKFSEVHKILRNHKNVLIMIKDFYFDIADFILIKSSQQKPGKLVFLKFYNKTFFKRK